MEWNIGSIVTAGGNTININHVPLKFCNACDEGFFHKNSVVEHCRDCTKRKRSEELKASLKEINRIIYNTHVWLIWAVILFPLCAFLSELIMPISHQDKSLMTLFWIIGKWGSALAITLLLSNKLNKVEKVELNHKQKEIQDKYPFEREGENL